MVHVEQLGHAKQRCAFYIIYGLCITYTTRVPTIVLPTTATTYEMPAR